MSISDSAVEAYHLLLRDFHHYSDWNYPTKYWESYIMSIFHLARIDFSIRWGGPFFLEDGSIHVSKKTPEIRMNDYILECLQVYGNSNLINDNAVEILVKVAKENLEIRDAIKSVYEWRTSSAGIAELLSRPSDEVVPIEKLYKLVIDE